MRILHVGSFGTRRKGAFLHSVGPKLSRGLIRLGHHVLEFDDRETASRAPFGVRRLGLAAANRALETWVADEGPDLLLLGHADTIRPATLAKLRREHPRLRVMQWNVDPLFDEGNCRRIEAKLPVVDATLISTAGDALRRFRQAGMTLGFLPNPADPALESGRADLLDAPDFDLFYACGHPRRPLRHIAGQEWDMDVLAERLRAAIPGLRACLPGIAGAAHLHGAAYQEALGRAACGLNASKRNDFFLYASDRLAHMATNGQAVLIERATGYGTLFGDDEMLFFDTVDELAAQIRRAIAEPAWRQAVAQAGRARYIALFDAMTVARYVLDVAFGTLRPSDYEFPTIVS